MNDDEVVLICGDCGTTYTEDNTVPFCHECGSDEFWTPEAYYDDSPPVIDWDKYYDGYE